MTSARAAKREATREAVRCEVAAAGGLAKAAEPWEPGRTRAIEKAFAGTTPEEATEIATGRAAA